MTLRTKYSEGQIAVFFNKEDHTDPMNGTRVVVTGVNPLPSAFSETHYSVHISGTLQEDVALESELFKTTEVN